MVYFKCRIVVSGEKKMERGMHKSQGFRRAFFTISAFTLIELVTVIIIISVLAAIAVPTYNLITEKSRTAEAKTTLRAILDAQRRFAFKHDQYANSLSKLDIELDSQGNYYSFSLSADNPQPNNSNNDEVIAVATRNSPGPVYSINITERGSIDDSTVVTGSGGVPPYTGGGIETTK